MGAKSETCRRAECILQGITNLMSKGTQARTHDKEVRNGSQETKL